MKWPWAKADKRQSTSYTDAVTTAIFNASTGNAANQTAAASAVLEACAGIISRCFLVADIRGAISTITGRMLADVARDLIRRGESLYILRMIDDVLTVVPSASWDITGGVGRETWRYGCEMAAPGGTQSTSVPSDAVLHFQYAIDPARPWVGLGPIQLGSQTSVVLGNLEQSMGYEAGGNTGRLLPVPGTEQSEVDALKDDLRGMRGRIHLVEAGDWGHGRESRPRDDWETHRVGPEFTTAEVSAVEGAARMVAGSCGVPIELLFPGVGQAAQREGWRRLLHGTVQPLARLMSMELSAKLETEVSMSFEQLFASDLSGRARAFQSMVGVGMEVERAARLAGLSESA